MKIILLNNYYMKLTDEKKDGQSVLANFARIALRALR